MFLKLHKCFTLFPWNFSEIQLNDEVLKIIPLLLFGNMLALWLNEQHEPNTFQFSKVFCDLHNLLTFLLGTKIHR